MKEETDSLDGYAVLKSLYRSVFGDEPELTPLPPSGSDRRYVRMDGGDHTSVVGTIGCDVAENSSFVQLAEVFKENGIHVPGIYAVSEDGKCYLQEDLGDVNLLSLLATPTGMRLAEESLRELASLQTIDEGKWSARVFARPFSRRMVMWDLNYFKYEFLKPSGIVFDEDLLEDDFERFAERLTAIDERLMGFMFRDFQSRNVLVKDCTPYFIDFQGGRKGPLLYDAVSFLWQAKAGFTAEERKQLLDVYAGELSARREVGKEEILAWVTPVAMFRTMQVLGAYGFRGIVEKKAHFIESIPLAIANLAELIGEGGFDAYPELKRAGMQILDSRFARRHDNRDDGLTVKVFSFSYKKGYPEDLSGNGGGFMFDCRGMHNPGRYDEYKALTGLDGPVIEFLEEKGEVQQFVAKAVDIVSPVIERYSARGFSGLQIGFGCTGGRHRSVYCAQRVAELLAAKYPDVSVELLHREQGISRIYNERDRKE